MDQLNQTNHVQAYLLYVSIAISLLLGVAMTAVWSRRHSDKTFPALTAILSYLVHAFFIGGVVLAAVTTNGWSGVVEFGLGSIILGWPWSESFLPILIGILIAIQTFVGLALSMDSDIDKTLRLVGFVPLLAGLIACFPLMPSASMGQDMGWQWVLTVIMEDPVCLLLGAGMLVGTAAALGVSLYIDKVSHPIISTAPPRPEHQSSLSLETCLELMLALNNEDLNRLREEVTDLSIALVNRVIGLQDKIVFQGVAMAVIGIEPGTVAQVTESTKVTIVPAQDEILVRCSNCGQMSDRIVTLCVDCGHGLPVVRIV